MQGLPRARVQREGPLSTVTGSADNPSRFHQLGLILVVLGFHCCSGGLFSSCGKQGYSLVAVCGLLLLWSIGCRCMGFSSCGTWAQ